jgi:hypothetical protein
MKLQCRKALSMAIAAMGMGLAASASATLLLPGTGPLAVDILAAAPGGSVLASASTPLSTPNWSGIARAAVVQASPGSTLDFYYQVSNNAGSTDALGRVTAGDFLNIFSTNVFQTGTAFSIFPAGSQGASSGDRGTLGVVGFTFAPGAGGTGKVDAGETSNILIVRTNATLYTNGVMGILNGTGTFAPGFAPMIPEPGTMALLATGLLALGGIARRRMR